MHIYWVIKRPLITEKTALAQENGIYTVIIDRKATKVDVKNAFLGLYGVAVADVRVLNTRPKYKFGKKGIIQKKGIERKAIVQIADTTKTVDFTQIVSK